MLVVETAPFTRFPTDPTFNGWFSLTIPGGGNSVEGSGESVDDVVVGAAVVVIAATRE